MKKNIIITIITVVISSLITICVYKCINNKQINNNNENRTIGTINGKYEIREIKYTLPSFTMNAQGLFHTPIIKETLNSLKTYEITANISDNIYVYHNTYKGIKVKDVINIINQNNRDYQKIIFKSISGLQIQYLKEDISDTLFLVFEKDGIKYPKNSEVNLLNPETPSSYNITNVKTIYFE